MRGRLTAARQRRFQMNHTSRQLQDFAPLKFLIQSQSPILPVLRRLNRRRFPSKATNLPFDNGSRKAPFPVVDHPDAVARRRLRIAKRGNFTAAAYDRTPVSHAQNPSSDSADEFWLGRPDLGFRKDAEPPRDFRVGIDQVSEFILEHLVSKHFARLEIP